MLARQRTWIAFALVGLVTLVSQGWAPRAGAEPDANPAWKQFWSFKPVSRPAVPSVKDPAWVRNPIDAFVLAKLEASGLKPAPEADRQTLIRRLTFDLTGLPPTPEEIRAFLADKSPTRTKRWSIDCSPARTTASTGAATGWTSPATSPGASPSPA